MSPCRPVVDVKTAVNQNRQQNTGDFRMHYSKGFGLRQRICCSYAPIWQKTGKKEQRWTEAKGRWNIASKSLKGCVMAVFTHLSEEEIAQAVAPFALGRLQQVQPIAQGVENSNWKLSFETASGVVDAIFTLFESRTNPDDLPFFIGLMDHLAQRGVPCPAPYITQKGEKMVTVRGRPAVLVRFLSGQNMASQSVTLMHSLGAAMAQMHLAGADYPMQRRNDLSVQGWRRLTEKTAARLDEIAPGLQALVCDELAFHEAHWPDDLPRGIIHADLFRDNVMAQGDAVVGLFDFYFACTDLLAYDLAICLNCWCFDDVRRFRREWAEAMLAGYESVRPLSDAERAAMVPLARGAALRFLLTRAHDWLFHPPGALVEPKDPLEYAVYLEFFRMQESL